MRDYKSELWVAVYTETLKDAYANYGLEDKYCDTIASKHAIQAVKNYEDAFDIKTTNFKRTRVM